MSHPTVVPVTSIRLPTAALEKTRDAWENLDDDDLRDNATALLRDLFDGQDGHLTRIDEVLPR